MYKLAAIFGLFGFFAFGGVTSANAGLWQQCTIASVTELDYFGGRLRAGQSVNASSDHGHDGVRIGEDFGFYSENLDAVEWMADATRTEINVYPRDAADDQIQIEIVKGGIARIYVSTPHGSSGVAAYLNCD